VMCIVLYRLSSSCDDNDVNAVSYVLLLLLLRGNTTATSITKL